LFRSGEEDLAVVVRFSGALSSNLTGLEGLARRGACKSGRFRIETSSEKLCLFLEIDSILEPAMSIFYCFS
jgi:hypothetical protein